MARPATRQPGRDGAAALRSLRVLVAALTRSARTIESHTGVTSAQLFLLRQLAVTDALSINELAERARTRQNTVSSVVGRLVRDRLVEKVRSPSDGRRAALSLTPRGRRILARAPASSTELIIDGLDSLASRDLRKLSEGLRALVDALDLKENAAPLLFDDDHPSD